MSRSTTCVGGGRARLVRRALTEHRGLGQRVDDVAGECELLGRGRDRLDRTDRSGDLLVGLGLVDLEDARGNWRSSSGPSTSGLSNSSTACGLGVPGPLGLLLGPLPRRTSERLVAQLGQAAGHGVQRRVGHDEQAERDDEHQQRRHDVRALEQVDEDGGEQEADRAAGFAHGVRIGVAGTRHAVREVHESEDATGDRAPADDLAAGRTVAVGMTQRAPGDHDEQQRDGPREDAHAAGGDRADQRRRRGRGSATTPTRRR